FFSSRRRHTRWPRDWSSDVCSSDLRQINLIRDRVSQWRQGGHAGHLTSTTRRLMNYWTDPGREKKLFFCQIEALETAIYLAEVRSEERRVGKECRRGVEGSHRRKKE